MLALLVFDRVYIALFPPFARRYGQPRRLLARYWLGVGLIVVFAVAGAASKASHQSKINKSVLMWLDEINRGLIRIRDESRSEDR